ncbi:MAG: NAD(P)-dependent glycerol-3-phosphate dehydrogenase [Candidatus Marinimicrobia bacterium]|nr:NAD(P)-dependent glycerol-3-phosphate dehydrogenase [Candidatus Neomarinimicrobiota bacterium]MBT7377253.1 NAD(P)-dependent glycerol-3-phosphate dehydrogenase [Candidatus Neomarinimicrobiota bacterium]|tara:strand:+ start:3286 stop:4272 length:987 start_codon:yes stop_codon:yes gene_type:complete
MKIGVIGAGSWGAALSQVLAGNGSDVVLWHHRKDAAITLQSSRQHVNLPASPLINSIKITSELSDLPKDAPILITIPTHSFHSVLPNLCKLNPSFVICASKGIENETGLLMSNLISNLMHISENNIVALSGPSHAEEVYNKIPTAVVSASSNISISKKVQKLFSNEYFRVYSSSDIKGVEVGGAVKNVIAISAGICQGLQLGDNTMAALLTRGLQEIIRLGVHYGAEIETFSGLSGIGDLMVTSFSKHSRNRHVGFMLGQGKPLSEILEEMDMVAEGVNTTKSINTIAQKHNLSMPICEETFKVLFEGKPPQIAIAELMKRDLVNEYI